MRAGAGIHQPRASTFDGQKGLLSVSILNVGLVYSLGFAIPMRRILSISPADTTPQHQANGTSLPCRLRAEAWLPLSVAAAQPSGHAVLRFRGGEAEALARIYLGRLWLHIPHVAASENPGRSCQSLRKPFLDKPDLNDPGHDLGGEPSATGFV